MSKTTQGPTQWEEEGSVAFAARLEPDRVSREVSLLDIALILAKHKREIVRVTAAFALAAIVISLLLPNIYTATVSILPPREKRSGALALLGQLGGGGTTDAMPGLDVSDSSDLYVAMLQSRTVADELISRFHLLEVYGTTSPLKARKKLGDATRLAVGTEGIISVYVDDRSPQRAMELANGYADALRNLNQGLAITEASKRRLFFETQLKLAKQQLADAEVELKKTQQKTGLIQLDSQARVIIESAAVIRAQIAAKEVQLAAMRSFATEQNPEYVRLQAELAGLQTQLARLQKEHPASQGGMDSPTPGSVPEAGLEYVRKYREVKYNEAIFDILARQYEVAKIDESKGASIIQVMDPAILPERKSKPVRTLIILLATLVGMLAGILWALGFEFRGRLNRNPEYAQQFKQLRAYLTDWKGLLTRNRPADHP
jgi:uncharacterized protein involved in exopolysaccharide biosynthesis